MARPKARRRSTLTFAEAIDQFTAYLAEQERSEHTSNNYREDLGSFAGWYEHRFGEAPVLALLDPAELRDWKRHLREERQLEPATVNRKLAAARSFLRWALAAGHAPEIVGPKSIREVRRPPRWLSGAEQRALLRAARRSGRPRDAELITLLLHTGLRLDEAAEMRRPHLTVKDRSGSLVVPKGKGRKQRTIPLNAEARAALRKLLDRAPAKAPEVLWGQRGPLTARGIQAIVCGYESATGIEGLSPHVLRHSFCKNLADAGVPIQIIADLAGHESLETTRRYVQPGHEDLAAAVEKIGRGEE